MKEEGIRTQQVESKLALAGFEISIVLSILGLSLITMLISFIPNSAKTFDSFTLYPTINSNFFYGWGFFIDFGLPNRHALNMFEPITSYYIFSVIAGLLLLISNSGIFVQSKERTKQLIFINCGFYVIPIIAFIVKMSLMLRTDNSYMEDDVFNILITFGFYALMYLPLQIVLLLEKKTLFEFFGFQRKDHNMGKKEIIGRRINAVITILIYLSTIMLLIKPIFYEFPSSYSINVTVISVITTILGVWFLTNFLIILNKYLPDIKKAIFGFLVGIIIAGITYGIIMAIDFTVLLDFPATNYYTLEFPRTLLVTLFTVSLILILSIPIGFLASNTKHTVIVASILGVLISAFNIFLIVMTFENSDTPGIKIYSIFLCLFYLSLIYAGAFWGRFLGRKLFDEKPEPESIDNIQEPVPTEALEV
ncbi:MAG: hypothetical protein ACTSSK_04590 [Candidatus Heimdallarchaeota archaeon]